MTSRLLSYRAVPTKLPDGWALRVVVALFLFSLLLRGAYLVAGPGPGAPLTGDEPAYHGIARSFVTGGGWQKSPDVVARRPPTISFVLAVVYWVLRPDPAIGRWTLVVASSLGAPLVFWMSRQIFPARDDVAVLSSAAWSVYPPSIFYVGLIQTETLAPIFAIGAIGGFFWAARSGKWQAAALTGALWALLALTRVNMVLLPFFMLGAQLVLGRLAPSITRWSARQWYVGLLAFLLTMTPWTVRNYVELGAFVPTTTHGGWVFMISNGTLSNWRVQQGGFWKNPELVQRYREEAKSEAERTAVGFKIGLEGIRKGWRLLPRAVFYRGVNFWTTRPDPYDPSWTRNDSIMLVVWGPVLAFFLIALRRHPWRRLWPAYAAIVLAFLMTLAFWGSPRFRYPVDPVIVVLAASAFVAVLGALRGRFQGAAAAME